MVKNISLLFVCQLFLWVNVPSFAQTTIKSVTRLSDKLNSNAEEIMPLLSSTGDTLFFARVFYPDNEGGVYSGSDIWYSTFNHSKMEWGAPSNNLRGWNDKRNNFIVGTSWNSSIIYLNHPKSPEKGIQFVKYAYNKWTNPETIPVEGLPSSGYQGLFVSPDYEAMIVSMQGKNSLGEEDLYVILKDEKGKWGNPINLGSSINTSSSEISPFLSLDKNTLYFASQGHGGFGDMDIFMAKRLYNSWNVWSKPENLGKEINSEAFDAYYSQYGDSIAFFSSNREGDLADIFEVRMEKPVISGSNNIMRVASGSEVSGRNYLSQETVKEIFGYHVIPSIELSQDESIQDNPMAGELIWHFVNKFKANPDVKLTIKVFVLKDMTSEKMVIESSRIAKYIASEMEKLGIEGNRIQYDGVSIGNMNQTNELAFQVQFSFFK
ncbi:PD40 domain-containing protein [Marivirga sp. S37H4]|uniref:PD40 domain-containing protein n=1 Tax=Marivirga aurantiaca TaxID=2802615 RepID=A0A934X180_9BACT|nr:PD40 domain-containing protein [Marivirga aurantiaca]MBK6266535.1 PD40 domain-containing protein [Marivirga aurantiaca]